ncbi:MAG: hypothetical protein FWC50_09445 [Planctomycetaceae bacterium]|nr:hypothetical protein [Planctomycetaceae bacterium]
MSCFTKLWHFGATGSRESVVHFFPPPQYVQGNMPQPVWTAVFGLAQTPCDAGLAVFRSRNFQPV